MVKIQKYVQRLNPKTYTGKRLFEIVAVDETKQMQIQGKRGFLQYELLLLGGFEGAAGEFRVSFLFDRDLTRCVETWGEDTDKWKGKKVDVSAEKDGEYMRWNIQPVESI